MAFTLQAIQGSDTLTLTSAPYSLLRATGMGGAAVRRVTAQGPNQRGDTDLGYRLLPRQLELQIGIEATTDALLDSYRDDLVAIFKPLTDSPVKLRVTRDDGEVRQLDCYLRDEIRIDLVPEHRPGHYHRVTVPLVAPEPAYYGITPGTVNAAGTVGLASNWYLAGGAIGSANVMMHGSVPGTNSTWSYSGTLAATSSWTLAVRADFLTSSGSTSYLFNSLSGDGPRFFRRTDDGTPHYVFGGDTYTSPGMIAGTNNYIMRQYYNINGEQAWYIPAFVPTRIPYSNHAIVGTAMRWRTNGWTGTVRLYALYNIAISESQRHALYSYMDGSAGSVAQVVNVPYAGDLPEYPVIRITGPITGPSVTNTATGDSLDFGTIAIGAGTTYVIDTRYGVKSILAGTVDKRNELTADSDLGTWSLVPDPIATGGTNVLSIGGSNSGTATQISVIYYDRFASF